MELVVDGVYQVKRGFRAFVIDGDEGLTLIDTGLPKQASVFVAGIESIGRSVSDIVAILLTHSHADHAGGAAQLKRDSGAELYCSAADTPAVQGAEKAPTPPFLDRTPLQVLKPLLGLLPGAEPAVVDHQIQVAAGSALPEDLVAYASPGHTPGHTSYRLDRAGGVLFVGDAVLHRGGTVNRGWFNRSTPDIDQSARELATLDFEVACFGHADPITRAASTAFKTYAATL
jgi:glyoxylase-like metal-dependent hydrolase (beta-lactamase superfamily II)